MPTCSTDGAPDASLAPRKAADRPGGAGVPTCPTDGAPDASPAPHHAALAAAVRAHGAIALAALEQRALVQRRRLLLTQAGRQLLRDAADLDAGQRQRLGEAWTAASAFLAATVPAADIDLLPPGDAQIPAIFDLALRVYQKHVVTFSLVMVAMAATVLAVVFVGTVALGILHAVSPWLPGLAFYLLFPCWLLALRIPMAPAGLLFGAFTIAAGLAFEAAYGGQLLAPGGPHGLARGTKFSLLLAAADLPLWFYLVALPFAFVDGVCASLVAEFVAGRTPPLRPLLLRGLAQSPRVARTLLAKYGIIAAPLALAWVPVLLGQQTGHGHGGGSVLPLPLQLVLLAWAAAWGGTFAVHWAVAEPALILDNARDPFDRSRALVRAHFWRAAFLVGFTALLTHFLDAFTTELLALLLALSQELALPVKVVANLGAISLYPLYFVTMVVFYLMRRRDERGTGPAAAAPAADSGGGRGPL